MAFGASTSSPGANNDVVVWDPFVRIAHWALALAFVAAYLSAEEEGGTPHAVHVWAGYLVGVIVAARIVWGFVGPRHARFADFITGPVAALQYLRDLLMRNARRYIGHSPAGGAMVIVMLVFLAATVVTGIVAYGEQGKGPLGLSSPAPVSTAYADEDSRNGNAKPEGEDEENLVAELHGLIANLTLGLVVLHVLGVALASSAHHENLVRAMIHGRKRLAP